MPDSQLIVVNGNAPSNISVRQFVNLLEIIRNYIGNQQEIILLHYIT